MKKDDFMLAVLTILCCGMLVAGPVQAGGPSMSSTPTPWPVR